MSLTPGKDHSVQVLHGTIYEKVTAGGFTYHMHAAVSKEALLTNAVWTIWRENDTTGQIVPPTDGTVPTPDENVGSNPAGLVYWSTT